MFAHKKLVAFGAIAVIITTILSACAQPTPAVVEKEVVVEKLVVETVVVEKEVVVEKLVEVEKVVVVTPMPDKYGGTLRVGIAAIHTLDVNSVAIGHVNYVMQDIYETLVDRTASGEIKPLLIREIEISDDGLEHTWRLQTDVRFHDGSEFNAEVVKWNLERKVSLDQPMARELPDWDIEILDDHTLKVTLDRPAPALYALLNIKTFSMMSRSFIEEVGDDALRTQASGTGPFMVDEYRPEEVLRLKRNPDYWQSGLPYLDEIVIMALPDVEARSAMLEAGEIDLMLEPSIEAIERFGAREDLKVHAGPGGRQYYMAMDNLRPPTDDVLVRRALNYAVDREAMAETVFRGWATPSTCNMLTPAITGYCKVGSWEYDPEKSRQLLEQAGWTLPEGASIREKDGEKLELVLRTLKGHLVGDIERAELVQHYLREVGVDVKIDIGEAATFYAKMNVKRDENYPVYHLFNGAASPFTGDARQAMFSWFKCDSWPPVRFNYSFYCNPEVDELFQEAEEATSLEERNAIYCDIFHIVWDDTPQIPLFDGLTMDVAHSSVQGLYLDPGIGVWPHKWAWFEQ